jgi:methionyl-tRNA formyltransferase
MPQALLDIAPRGAINFHWSLLPKYRGASPIQAAIINGEEKTGATVMLMDTKMDHGAILTQFEDPIRPDDTSDTLYHRLSTLGAPLLANTIIKYVKRTIIPTEQDHSQTTFVKLLSRDDGKLDPTTHTATELERRVRAYQPWPGTFIELQGKRLKVLRASVGKITNAAPGTTIEQERLPAVVGKDRFALLLQEVQPEGKTAMSGASFLQGQRSIFVKE